MKEKTWKQCYRAHERRMWITGVGLPLAGIVATVYCNDNARNAISHAYANAKFKVNTTINDIKSKIDKKKNEKKNPN